MPRVPTTKELQETALNRGLIYLDQEYLGVMKPHDYRCVLQGHLIKTRPNNVKNGHRCRECQREKHELTIPDLQEYALRHGFEFIESEYRGGRKPHKYRCLAAGHITTKRPDDVQLRVQGCKSCYNETQRTYKNDIERKIANNLRSRISKAVRSNQKRGSAVNDLGCSISEFKAYLEVRFVFGMSWNNYGNHPGQWCIDHIRPLSDFDLTDRNELLKACHYTNQQPMWYSENCRKHDSVDWPRKP